jgi:UDP-N-acetylmuramate-alanine ligase
MGKILYQSGQSIECISSKIKAKRISFHSFIKTEKMGLLSQYKCERDGEAVIVKELSPKKHKIISTSSLNSGDKIQAEKFVVMIDQKSRIKISKENFSGRHNCNATSTSCFTCAQITLPFNHIIQALKAREGTAIRLEP